MSDGGSWRECEFRRALDEGRIKLPKPQALPGEKIRFVLVGDDAFPLGPGLLKPYAKRDMTIPQRITGSVEQEGFPRMPLVFSPTGSGFF